MSQITGGHVNVGQLETYTFSHTLILKAKQISFLGDFHIVFIEEDEVSGPDLVIYRFTDETTIDRLTLPENCEYFIHKDNTSNTVLVFEDLGFYKISLNAEFRMQEQEFIELSFQSQCIAVDNGLIYHLVDSNDSCEVLVTDLQGRNQQMIYRSDDDIQDIYAEKDMLFVFGHKQLCIINVQSSDQVYIDMVEYTPLVVEELYSFELNCFVFFFSGNDEYKCLIMQRDMTYIIIETGIKISEEPEEPEFFPFILCSCRLLIVEDIIYIVEGINLEAKSVSFTPVSCMDIVDIISSKGIRLLHTIYEPDLDIECGMLTAICKE
ncbi:hypothetical protein PCE1_004067 [Barthelona sp. PCE]